MAHHTDHFYFRVQYATKLSAKIAIALFVVPACFFSFVQSPLPLAADFLIMTVSAYTAMAFLAVAIAGLCTMGILSLASRDNKSKHKPKSFFHGNSESEHNPKSFSHENSDTKRVVEGTPLTR